MVLHQLDSITATYKRRSSRVKEARYDYSTKREHVRYHWSTFEEDLKSLRECGNNLLGSSVAKVEETAPLRKKFQSDCDVLLVKLRKVDKLMKELSDCHHKLKEIEKAQDNASASLLAVMRRRGVHPDAAYSDENCTGVSLAPTSQLESVTSSKFDTPLAPELAAYYDAVHTCRFMKERLNDQLAEHREQIDRRQLLADQDQPSEMTDEEFEAECELNIRKTRKELQSAQSVLAQAEKACIEAGIEFPRREDLRASVAESDLETSSFSHPRASSTHQHQADEAAQISSTYPVRTMTQDERRLQSDAAQMVSSLRLDLLYFPSDISSNAWQKTTQWLDSVVTSVGSVNPELHSNSGSPISDSRSEYEALISYNLRKSRSA